MTQRITWRHMPASRNRREKPYFPFHCGLRFSVNAQAEIFPAQIAKAVPVLGEEVLSEEHYIVVQPTVASFVPVIEAKTTGEPPLREPYSRV